MLFLVNRLSPLPDTGSYLMLHIKLDRVILKPNTIDELGSTLDALCKELRSRRT